MKNELYSFETVASPAASWPIQVGSVAPRAPLPFISVPGGRALTPSHFPQFPLDTQNMQKSPYSRAFCDQKHAIPTSFPTFFHSPKNLQKRPCLRVFSPKDVPLFPLFPLNPKIVKNDALPPLRLARKCHIIIGLTPSPPT